MPPETPQNAGYMIAAYVVAPVILVGYLVSLWGRVKRTLDRIIGDLTHVCRACDRKYYAFALAKVVRDYFAEAKENWKAELPLMQEVIQMYVGVGRGVGITQYPLTEKAWKELESRDDHDGQ